MTETYLNCQVLFYCFSVNFLKIFVYFHHQEKMSTLEKLFLSILFRVYVTKHDLTHVQPLVLMHRMTPSLFLSFTISHYLLSRGGEVAECFIELASIINIWILLICKNQVQNQLILLQLARQVSFPVGTYYFLIILVASYTNILICILKINIFAHFVFLLFFFFFVCRLWQRRE